jgi:hypothetical protein
MKKYISIIVVLSFTMMSFSVTLFRLNNIGVIQIPDELELQSGAYKTFVDSYTKLAGVEADANRYVFQQKGLNEGTSESKSQYVRVIVETSYESPGSYSHLSSNPNLSSSELSEMDNTFRQNILSSLASINQKLIQWKGTDVVYINGMYALHCCYTRQLDSNPIVLVNVYNFQNYDRMHRLTLSNRVEDNYKWAPLFKSVVNSFKITNVK